jgi:hypothetical protein
MALPGETILQRPELAEGLGAPNQCCGKKLDFQVLRSNAGYYIGTFCPNCGPYSRESDYFRTDEEAQAALQQWQRGNYVHAR